MRCGAFQDSSQIEHAMWEPPAFFLLPCYETIKKLQSSSKTRRLDILRYIAPFPSLSCPLLSKQTAVAQISIQALTSHPKPSSKLGRRSQSKFKRSLFVCRPALSKSSSIKHIDSPTTAFFCALRLSSEHVQYSSPQSSNRGRRSKQRPNFGVSRCYNYRHCLL
jgi:hypothetical protein